MKHVISMDVADSDNFALAVEMANQCNHNDELIIAISPRHCNYERTAFIIENGKVHYEEYNGDEILSKQCEIKDFFAGKRLWRKPEELNNQDKDSTLHGQAMLADVARLLENSTIKPSQVKLVIGQTITDAVSDTIIAPEYAFMTIDEDQHYRLRTPDEFVQYKKDMMCASPATRRELRRMEANKKIEYLRKCKFSDCVINLSDNSNDIQKLNLDNDDITIYAAGPMTFLAEMTKRVPLPANHNITFKGMMFSRNTKENIFGDNFNLVVDPLSAEIVISQLFPKCTTIQCYPTDIFKGNKINWASFQKGQLENVNKKYGLTSEIANLILLYNIGTGNNKLNAPFGTHLEVLTKPVFDLALAIPITNEATSSININIINDPEVYGGKRFEIVDDTKGNSKIQMVRVDKLNLDVSKPGGILDLILRRKQSLNKLSPHWMRIHHKVIQSNQITERINMGIADIIHETRNCFLKKSPNIINQNMEMKTKGVKLVSIGEKRIFGIEKEAQKEINYDELRHIIYFHLLQSTKNKASYPRFTQLIGDSQLFTTEGTKFAQALLSDFTMNKYPESIILYGFTGKYDESKSETDTNHLLSFMLDNKGIEGHRVLANVVDYHTPIAIRDWPGVSIPNNIENFTLVYTNTDKPEAKFGDDTPTTDNLTNTAAICFEGGIQSLLQTINLLNKNIPVIGVYGLRDFNNKQNPKSHDIESGKPYLSAVEFLQYIKDKTCQSNKEINKSSIQLWTEQYLMTHALFNKNAKDAETKLALWNEALEKMIDNRTWEKLGNLEIMLSPSMRLLHQKSLPLENEVNTEISTNTNKELRLYSKY